MGLKFDFWEKKFIVVLLTFLVLTSSAEAKDSSGKFAINGKMGYFSPEVNSEVDRFYGGGRVFSLGGEYNFSSAFSMILSLDYKKLDSNEKEEWEVVKVEEDYLQIVPITFSIIYKIPIGNQKKFLPYIGGGVGIYLTKLKFEVSEISNPYTDWTIVDIRGKFPMLKATKSNLSYNNSVKATG